MVASSGHGGEAVTVSGTDSIVMAAGHDASCYSEMFGPGVKVEDVDAVV